jgi:hypothetical protein
VLIQYSTHVVVADCPRDSESSASTFRHSAALTKVTKARERFRRSAQWNVTSCAQRPSVIRRDYGSWSGSGSCRGRGGRRGSVFVKLLTVSRSSKTDSMQVATTRRAARHSRCALVSNAVPVAYCRVSARRVRLVRKEGRDVSS